MGAHAACSLLMSYLAYTADRSFVFEDYVWSHLPLPYTLYDFALRPVRIPLNAFISGPTAGGPMLHSRAISAEFWDSICPPEKRRVISSKDMPDDAEGQAIIDWWIDRLKIIQDECVEIDSSQKVIFDRTYAIPATFVTSSPNSLLPFLVSSIAAESSHFGRGSPLPPSSPITSGHLLSNPPFRETSPFYNPFPPNCFTP
jgi:hypothetical protein